jgi:DNA (cytosine-5)-methyltransferase 1
MDIDVLTSGMPWHHRKAHDRHSSGRKAIRDGALEAVKKIKPKSFIFEVLSRDRADVQLTNSFKDAKYAVRYHRVDVAALGLPQKRPRYLMIGVRKGAFSNLSMPVIDPPVRTTVLRAIGDLVDKHFDANLDKGERKALKKRWRDLLRNKYAPPFANEVEQRDLKGWKEIGIDVENGGASTAPDIHETGLRLTNSMRKRLQGIPDEWNVEGASSSNSNLIEASLPPVAAKMIGLAIHSALRGTEFDYRRALSTPILKRSDRVLVNGVAHRVTCAPDVSAFISNPGQAIADQEIRRRRRWDTSTVTSDSVIEAALEVEEASHVS